MKRSKRLGRLVWGISLVAAGALYLLPKLLPIPQIPYIDNVLALLAIVSGVVIFLDA